MSPPFNSGDIVTVKGAEHLGRFTVDSCEWYEPGPGGAAPYWLCDCTGIRKPIDWSKIPAGATGIVTGSGWRGSAEHLVLDDTGLSELGREAAG